jgi:hypothetical protein
MYDKAGNAYTTLPVVENSIVLGKTQAIAQEYSVNDISECAITINPTSYTYDGTSKEPDVTVMDGTTTLALWTLCSHAIGIHSLRSVTLHTLSTATLASHWAHGANLICETGVQV